MTLTDEQLRELLTLPHELPDVEFKGPGLRSDNPLFGRVVRAAIGMANRPGGGLIILGMEETASGFTPVGLTPQQLASWRYELIADGFNKYAQPPIFFEKEERNCNGKIFIVLRIHEFADTPVICISEYRDRSNPSVPRNACKVVLRPGAFYLRSRNKPETKEAITSEALRQVFDLISDKAVQKFVRQAQLSGLNLQKAGPKDQEHFEAQVTNWNSALLEQIHSRGYWKIIIRPKRFVKEHIRLVELFPLIQRRSIFIRGRRFPYIEGDRIPQTGEDWVGFENQVDRFLEAWRIYQSGQFALVYGIADDWLDRSSQHPAPEGWTPETALSVVGVVYRCTEIFEFVKQLALADAYQEYKSLHIEVHLVKVQGRALYSDQTQVLLLHRYATAAEKISYFKECSKEEAITQSQELAQQAAAYIFERFQWNPSREVLQSIQAEIIPN